MAAASINGTSCAVVFRNLRGALNDVMVVETLPKREAARNVILALENTRNAFDYHGVLSKQEDEVDSVNKERLAILRGMVTAIQSGTNEVLLNIPGRVQALISSLGLPRWRPCLVGVDPQYVAVVNGNEFVVSFLGKFKYATDEKYKPFLTLPDQRKFEPIKATTDRLIFRVTQSPFKMASCDHRDWSEATLNVPFENGKVLYDRRIFTYNIWLGSLPLAAGKNVKVTYSWTVIQPGITKQYLSPLTILDGKLYTECNEKRVHFLASDGSLIKKDSVEVIPSPEHTKGQQEVVITETTDTQVAVKIKVQNVGDQTGSVGFQVQFDEIPQMKIEHTSEPEEIVLRWGQETELQPKAFQIDYDSYDGSHFVITGVDSTKPYLKVVERSGNFFLIAEASKDL